MLGLLAVIAVAAAGAFFTAPRPGGRMDPASTSPQGSHALVALLRERGVEVVVAGSVDDVENAAGPDSLVLIAQTHLIRGEDLWGRLAAAPGDRLVLEPTAQAREALAPGVRLSRGGMPDDEPDCDLREAVRAGTVRIDAIGVYEHAGPDGLVRCYGGALVRYRSSGRDITVVSSAEFMTNGALLSAGNAALAMNLAGNRSRLVWYAPDAVEGDSAAGATIAELVPEAVGWIVVQLCLVVVLLAWSRGRRLGPLVAEKLPVVVRASETVEGRARLYRSRRARDQAAAALRTAALQRLRPRLGLAGRPAPAAVVSAVARRCATDENWTQHVLFGAPPQTDTDLFHLAAALDDIERKVSRS